MLAFAAIADTPLADDTEVRFINVPAASISVTGIAPDQVGNALRIFPPAANINLAGDAPAIVTGVTITPEQGRITLIKRAPQAVSTGAIAVVDALAVYDLAAPRPQILTGQFSERRVKFVILRQSGST